MAEIRKHDPDAGDDLARLVREALEAPAAGQQSADEQEEPTFSAADVPTWDPNGPMLQF